MREPTQDWRKEEFRKSSFSPTSDGQCVAVAKRPGFVAVYNDALPFGEAPIMECTTKEWNAFVLGVQNGEF